jgi:hypothetical protein
MKAWIPIAALALLVTACQEPPPTADPPAADSDAITFRGFGPAAFGADAQQVRTAWDGDLEAAPPESEGCHYLMPQPPPAGGYRIAFMIEGGRFVRIDVRAADIVAPGGGRVDMTAEEIGALYPGRVEERPHKYVEGGKYLRIHGESGSAVLLFSADADGRVSEWRIGVPPQVDYVEGCS